MTIVEEISTDLTALDSSLVPSLAPAQDEEEAASRSSESKGQVEWPPGFELRDDGLYACIRDDFERISGPFRVIGKARNAQSRGWGIALEWEDPDGVPHCEVVPHADLIAGNDVIRNLVDGGLDLSMSAKHISCFREALNRVLCNWRVLLVDKTGWHGTAFVLPDEVIGPTPEHLHNRGSRVGARFARRGSIESWKDGVAAPASGNPRMMLAISTAFAGPLFGMLNEQPIGIHIRGGSSTGKTTLLIAAGSVWGGGGPGGFCGTWRATANGLEATAAAHSGTCLILDELAEIDAQEAGKAAYALINGSGKQRAGRIGDARSRAEWCVPILSSGEITLADKIAEDRGRRTRAGVEVRFVDIDADAGKGFGVFEVLHGHANAAEFSDALRHEALTNYGTAGPALVAQLAEDFELVSATANRAVERICAQMTAGTTGGQVQRVARRFAIIGVAGEFARSALGLAWEPDESIDVVKDRFAEWKGNRGDDAAELTAALRAIRDAIDRHGQSRFEDRRQQYPSMPIRDRLGFRCKVHGETCWAFTLDGWREILGGVADPKWVARQLKERGWVLTDAVGNHGVPYKVDGHATRVIAIPETCLEKFDALP
jgi:putative DNA primase/helicase